MIGDTVGGGEELIGQRRHNHDGDEVRDIHQRLGKALEPFAAQLVEQQCEDDRRREGEDQVGQRDCQRVAQQTPEIRAGEEFFKVLQSGEGAAEQRLDGGVAIVGAEVLERHDQACHRRVVENEHVQDARDHQNVQPVMLHERFAPGVVPELRISAFVLLGPSTGRFTRRSRLGRRGRGTLRRAARPDGSLLPLVKFYGTLFGISTIKSSHLFDYIFRVFTQNYPHISGEIIPNTPVHIVKCFCA